MGSMRYEQAIALALAEEMRSDPGVVVWGVDVGKFGGAFAATKGLYDEFGADRVIDMPISEAGFTGLAVGAAMTGLRPVVELQFSDWITLASDQLINHAAKIHYMFDGAFSVPLVLRAPAGGFIRAAGQHSNSYESLFAHIPGLKVVYPSTPADAYGLLKASIRDENPVVYFEHKRLYGRRGDILVEGAVVPIGKAATRRPGSSVTVVTYAHMVNLALEVAEELSREDIDVEVLDLRTISPIDRSAIAESLCRTGRLVVVEESWPTCSVASEVITVACEECFESLRKSPTRVATVPVPIPFSPVLEDAVLPSAERIAEAIRFQVG